MRVSRLTAAVISVAALLGSSRLYAGAITLNPDGFQSDVSANANVGQAGPEVQSFNPVNSLPYTTPATETDGTASSTTTPNLSDSGLSATFSQTIVDPFSLTGGGIAVYFTANGALNYSIAGTMKVVGDDVEGQLNCSLFNETTESIVYNSELSFNDLQALPGATPAIPTIDTNTLNLSSSGGPLTGTLVAGDSYEFLISEEMDNGVFDPTLTGSGGMALSAVGGGGSSTPLPRSAPAAVGLVLLAAFGVRRLSRKPAKG